MAKKSINRTLILSETEANKLINRLQTLIEDSDYEEDVAEVSEIIKYLHSKIQ